VAKLHATTVLVIFSKIIWQTKPSNYRSKAIGAEVHLVSTFFTFLGVLKSGNWHSHQMLGECKVLIEKSDS
jgi:hypothetical protein